MGVVVLPGDVIHGQVNVVDDDVGDVDVGRVEGAGVERPVEGPAEGFAVEGDGATNNTFDGQALVVLVDDFVEDLPGLGRLLEHGVEAVAVDVDSLSSDSVDAVDATLDSSVDSVDSVDTDALDSADANTLNSLDSADANTLDSLDSATNSGDQDVLTLDLVHLVHTLGAYSVDADWDL